MRGIFRSRRLLVERGLPIHKQLHSWLAVTTTKPGVIGGAFITEMANRRQCCVVGEIPFVREDGLQGTAGHAMLNGTVELGAQIGRVKCTR